jgi:RimJ/RimL family protein N-acetyltransferase
MIRELAAHPAIFPHVSDDSVARPEDWAPIESELVRYLIAGDHEGPYGFAIFIPDTWTCWKAHIGFLPRSYGEMALTAFQEMLGWMWKNSTAARIVGEICVDNRRAIAFSKRAGFVEYGVNEKSRLRGGILRDQVCLGISKAE